MKFTHVAISAVIGAGLLSVAGASTSTAETFKLTAGSSHPPIVAWARALPALVVPGTAEKAEALGHSIEWTEAYAGALYDFQNTLEGVEEGLADVGWVGSLWEPSKQPLMNINYFAPFISNDIPLLASIGNRLKDLPEVEQEWTDANQKLLGIFAVDPYILLTKEPVNTLIDLDGLKLYTPGAVARWVEGTGAVGVDGGLPVYYEGIKNGITDGGIVPTTSVIPFKLFEVAPYVTVVQLGGAIAGGLSINLDTWNGLPADMQGVFEEIGAEYTTFVTNALVGFMTKTISDLQAMDGVTVTTFPRGEMQEWAQAVPNIAGEWVASTGPQAASVLKFMMDEARAGGSVPLRNWDLE
jgi:TRAP-type C4-dicarboxylate transport system substrate-binding protein